MGGRVRRPARRVPRRRRAARGARAARRARSPSCSPASTVPAGVAREAHRYLAAGGPANLANLLRFLSDTVLLTGLGFDAAADDPGRRASGTAPASARPGASGSPTGRWWPSSSTAPTWSPGTRRRRATCAAALEAAGADVLAISTYSLRADADGAVEALELCRDARRRRDHHVDAGRGRRRPATATAGHVPGLDALGIPVIQSPVDQPVTSRLAGRRRRARPARRGLGRRHPRVRRAHHRADVRLQGGRRRRRRPRSGDHRRPGRPRAHRPAGPPRRAHGPAAAASPTPAKRVALVLSAYPTKRARLGNAVGLDTPASAIAAAPRHARRRLPRRPHPGRRRRPDGRAGRPGSPTTSRCSPPRQVAAAAGAWPVDAYRAWFDAAARRRSRPAWSRCGARPPARSTSPTATDSCSPASTSAACWSRSSRRAGSAPTRSARTTRPTCPRPTTTWPSTGGSTAAASEGGGVPTPSSTSASTARWSGCRARRWPSRATATPTLAIADVPLFYPFVVNDPGEGTQAKRRSHAVIVDHLPPPLTRADTYDELAQLEQLLDALRPERGDGPGQAAGATGPGVGAARRAPRSTATSTSATPDPTSRRSTTWSSTSTATSAPSRTPRSAAASTCSATAPADERADRHRARHHPPAPGRVAVAAGHRRRRARHRPRRPPAASTSTASRRRAAQRVEALAARRLGRDVDGRRRRCGGWPATLVPDLRRSDRRDRQPARRPRRAPRARRAERGAEPGRAPTCCRPAATSTPSTPRPSRRALAWEVGRALADRLVERHLAETGDRTRPPSASCCGARRPCAPTATTSPRRSPCSACARRGTSRPGGSPASR